MKRYIKSAADTNSDMMYMTQKDLKYVFDLIASLQPNAVCSYDGWGYIELSSLQPKYRYMMADMVAKEKATADNYYKNSVGFWTKCRKPNRTPNHNSTKWYRESPTKGSEYWYTTEGVYRYSDHWGSDVASCSWYIEDRNYHTEGVVKGRFETAFIRWDDLKPKGWIAYYDKSYLENTDYLLLYFDGMSIHDTMYRPIMFEFVK